MDNKNSRQQQDCGVSSDRNMSDFPPQTHSGAELNRKNIINLLSSRKYIIFDGALGTMLQKHGMPAGENPALMNIKAPETVEMIHKMYIDAGSEIICANTFIANKYSLKGTGFDVSKVIKAAVFAAKRAFRSAAKPDGKTFAALDIGSAGHILEPAGDLSFEDAYEAFREMAVAGEEAGADLAAIETMSDPEELRAAMTAIAENTNLPIFATMTFDKSGYTYMGCTPENFAKVAKSLGAVAIGLNCSLEPQQMYGIAERLVNSTDLPLIIKPNAGLPDAKSGTYSITPLQFAEQMAQFKQLGVKIVGGCCGTTPEYIKELKKVFSNYSGN